MHGTNRVSEITRCSKIMQWLRRLVGKPLKSTMHEDKGFKSILNKSLHFKSSRFRESLLEIAMLCQEIAIASFVRNTKDF